MTSPASIRSNNPDPVGQVVEDHDVALADLRAQVLWVQQHLNYLLDRYFRGVKDAINPPAPPVIVGQTPTLSPDEARFLEAYRAQRLQG